MNLSSRFLIREIASEIPDSPAFLWDATLLHKAALVARQICDTTDIKLLYALKACPLDWVIDALRPVVHGYACSSQFEAILALSLKEVRHSVHYTAPALTENQIGHISALSDYITFNSLSQWERMGKELRRMVSPGLRINPETSLVADKRYDPCRPHSKLGIPLSDFAEVVTLAPDKLRGLEGIHIHSNCESRELKSLWTVIDKIKTTVPNVFADIRWLNLGGGYLLDEITNIDPLERLVEDVNAHGKIEIFMEPGAGIVQKAGYLVTTVVDIFNSTGKTIAMLDTSVNHLPEVFEYQFEPAVMEHSDHADHWYILAGATCLAGDIFGEYAFHTPLRVGSRLIFSNVGAYSLSKAHMFNGLNLPSIYVLTEDGTASLYRRFEFNDFLNLFGGTHARIREDFKN